MPSDEQTNQFRETVWDYFNAHRRDMPWRSQPTPYHVLVSELMLQQTQVSRVVPKYLAFMEHFPDVRALAAATLPEVLDAWSGLGYNRRAKFLHSAAQIVMRDFGGRIPDTLEELVSLPGVGKNTAGAVLAYAFNQPVVFVETNIRTVYFRHFFDDSDTIDDKTLLPLLEQTVDREHPREWYWALMDYGAHLKHTVGGNISRSKHYTRQSKFEGSRRQIRGAVVRRLLQGPVALEVLASEVNDERLGSVLDDLAREGFLSRDANLLRLTGELKLP
jgi:A/G-specific adenine glycosylase